MEAENEPRPFKPLIQVRTNHVFTTPQELRDAGFVAGYARLVAEGKHQTHRGEVFKFAAKR